MSAPDRVAVDWPGGGATSIREPFDLPEILTHADTRAVLEALDDAGDGVEKATYVEVDIHGGAGSPDRQSVRVRWIRG